MTIIQETFTKKGKQAALQKQNLMKITNVKLKEIEEKKENMLSNYVKF